MTLREFAKRALPARVRDAFVQARIKYTAWPPVEESVIHGYAMVVDPDPRRRLTFILPTASAANAFGGVITSLEVFIALGLRCGADLRVIIDNFEPTVDTSVIAKCASRLGVDIGAIEVVARTDETPTVAVRANDVFLSHNWWTTLNLQSLMDLQWEAYGSDRPHLYLIQDYEPLFYAFGSSHMIARGAFQTPRPCWGMFNTRELHDFVQLQGHRTERSFVFEPRLSEGLSPFLAKGPVAKRKRILVYGRPTVPRNCYPAITPGLRLWAETYAKATEWEVVSAGLPHPPVTLSRDKAMVSLGKLPLNDYAELLRETAVGLSLMASPHPSYPPLEMAHFGVRTVTNGYTCKDLSTSHPNITSLTAIDPASIASALAAACDAFDREPEAGWTAQTGRPSFLETAPSAFLDEVAEALESDVWAS